MRQAVGLAQRLKGPGVLVHQVQKALGQGVGLLLAALNVLLHGGVFLFAQGQAAHHVAQGHTDGANQGTGPAAAGHSGFAGQNLHKILAGKRGEGAVFGLHGAFSPLKTV